VGIIKYDLEGLGAQLKTDDPGVAGSNPGNVNHKKCVSSSVVCSYRSFTQVCYYCVCAV
jgi:hypothetical protein